MNENTKTMSLVGAALALLLVAWVTRPSPPVIDPESQIGKKFFPEFDDPLKAASLEIIEVDEDTGEQLPFKVAKVDGVWRIPSKLNYPADAADQLADVAASLIDVTKLDMIEESRPGMHADYSVVDPSDARPGDVGIGKRVTFRDASDKVLAQYIIGKQVDADQNPDLHYVRVPKQDAVYYAKIDTGKLKTAFADWIEDDLLKLNAWDIRRIRFNNYSIDEINGRVIEGDRLELNYDDKDAKWSLVGLDAASEELNTQKVNDMKNAIDDLKIVDVRRKPEGLSRELRAEGDGRLSPADQMSLQSHGYYFDSGGALMSNEGEVIIDMKEGIVYVLRFGEIALGTEREAGDEAEGTEKAAEPDAAGDTPGEGENRYVFVSASFRPELIPQPELEALPEGPAGPAQPEEGQVEEAPPAGEAADATEAASDKDEEADPERARIERENKRKQDEYDKKTADGEKKAKELNDRFADWYYVISDDVYRKIRLARSDVVKAKAAEGDAAGSPAAAPAAEDDSGIGVDDFNRLKEQAPEIESPTAP